MTTRTDPVIYQDRMPITDLRTADAPLLKAMKEWNIGKVDRKDRIHFCGMVYGNDGQTRVFLPRGLDALDQKSSRLTMLVLSQFGRDSASRDFASDGDHGNPGTLAVIAKLANDFRLHGLFIERHRVRSRNSGKPDWKRTVVRERAVALDEVGDIYPSISTTHSVDSSDTFLARIQACVMREIIEAHGWWLEGVTSRQADLYWAKQPHQPRSLWPKLLESLLPRLYSARSIFLATYLAHYLRETRASASGALVIGVEDFHTVWETMLRKTLKNVEDRWNRELPRAVYTPTSGDLSAAPEKRMLTDIIIRNGSGLTIVDAKYYEATSDKTLPGWPDIAKQMLYEVALRSVIGETERIRNCFAFPSKSHATSPYTTVKMRSRVKNEPVDTFPTIECHYLAIYDVMEAYKDKRRELTI